MAAATVTHSLPMRQLRIAVRETVESIGQVACAEAGTRIQRHQTFSDYGHPDRPEWIPLDVVHQIETVARREGSWPAVTRFQARRHGFALVRLPEGDPGCGDIHRALAEACKEHGDLVTGCLTDLGDGQVSPAEARKRMVCALEAAEAAMRLHAILEQIAEGA